MTFGVFFLAAILTFFAAKLPAIRANRPQNFRPEGVAFVGVVLLCAAIGFLQTAKPAVIFGAIAPKLLADGTVSEMKIVPQTPFPDWGLQVLALTGALYALSALRGLKGLPPWLADVLVVLASLGAILLFHAPTIDGLRLPFSNQWVASGAISVGLTVVFVWALSRMTASLNRTPQVTGGYLGLVSLTLLLAAYFEQRFSGASVSQTPASTWSGSLAFATMSCAALAGAGLASVPVALKVKEFNLGWSASLAMGFLLAQIAVAGLFKNLAFAMLGLMLLVLGLPVLDVSFYRVRAARRGQNVALDENRLRLHEVLNKRGIAPAKVSALYLALAFSLCFLGVLTLATTRWFLPLRLAFLGGLFFVGFVMFFSLIRVLMGRAQDEDVPESIEAFGVKISAVNMDEAMEKIEGFIQARTPHHVVTSDANAILRAQEDTEYAQILRNAALITPDGYGVIWGARLMNLPLYERVTGVDMVTGICERAAKNGYRIYILGSEPGIAATAAKNLAEKYPGLQVAGTMHGFWRRDGKEAGLTTEQADEKMADEIRRAQPEVLFVAMGIPMQEKFIAAQMARMNVPVCLGVGGSFDVYAGKYQRAPQNIQRLGLEWLYRVYIDPSRWKRMSYVPRFMLFALRAWLFGERRKGV